VAATDGLKPLGGERFWVALLLAPALIGLLLGALGSVVATVGISFFDWDLLSKPKWVGLSNYFDLPRDRMFMASLVNTTLFSALYVPLTIIISFAVACLMNRRISGIKWFRAIYFLPVVSSPTAVGLLWTWIYAQDQGVLNNIITSLGGNPVQWLGPKMILISVVIVNVWGAIGEGMIIFLAGLQAVPKQHYEAAQIEGANAFQRLIYVTLPMMAPSIFFQSVLATIHAFQAFDYIYILTRLGNGNSSLPTLVFSIYRNGFRFFRMGDAAAQAVILTLIIFVLTLIYFRIQKRWDMSA
jgi:multiple sugar transport system permease protein